VPAREATKPTAMLPTRPYHGPDQMPAWPVSGPCYGVQHQTDDRFTGMTYPFLEGCWC